MESNPLSLGRARTLALSDRGRQFNQEEWLKELIETGPDLEDEEQAIKDVRVFHKPLLL